MGIRSTENILVIASHPDDEVLGVGGTIAKKAMSGHDVFVVILATGIAARYPNPELHAETIVSEIDRLKKDAEKAAETLKIKEMFFLDFPDNRLDTVPKMDLTFKLKQVIDTVKPETVYIHHFGDYNWDHGIAFDVSLMACRPNVGDFFPRRIYSYEVLSSSERSFQNSSNVFCPNVFENIRDTIEQKKNALRCYTSESKPYPHPRSPEAVEYLARKRGIEVGLEFAEAFQLIREINP